MMAAYRWTHSPSRWLGLRVGGHLALSPHSSNEPSELLQWLCHDDSTLSIGISSRSSEECTAMILSLPHLP